MGRKPKEPQITGERRIKAHIVYTEWLKSIYPLESFEIQDENGETLYFYHGYNSYKKRNEPQDLVYHLRDEEFKKVEAERLARNLRGEAPKDEKAENAYYSAVKAYIRIKRENKIFDFYVPSLYNGGRHYARAIYNNVLHILEMLGIEEREEYSVQINGNSNHPFLQNMNKGQKANGENGTIEI